MQACWAVGVAKIFDLEGPKPHAMRSSEIFERKTFYWTNIFKIGRSKAVAGVGLVTRILLKAKSLNPPKKYKCAKWETC